MLDDIGSQNKAAWEHRAYEWRVSHQGTPQAVAKEMMNNPKKPLRVIKNIFIIIIRTLGYCSDADVWF
jgi:hypothetical protein